MSKDLEMIKMTIVIVRTISSQLSPCGQRANSDNLHLQSFRAPKAAERTRKTITTYPLISHSDTYSFCIAAQLEVAILLISEALILHSKKDNHQ
jgi:hypothetical protein